ncbi:MAG: SDR family oxidoreductase [Sphingomonadaceae bacterium]|nr:SDR family oxidoreductase [Sphingomonadaceae bacterium]
MDLKIKGKVALVIGGSRGIGRGVAEAFAAEGCKVVVASINPSSVEKAVVHLKAQGGDVIGVAGDCVTKDGIEQVVAETRRQVGAPDIAVFNVDSGPKGPFLEIDDETFAAANNNNVMAFIWMVRAVLPHMQEKRWGRILTIGTNSVKQPHRKLPRAAQNTYRVGALALCKSISAEIGQWNITINTLGTGAIETEQLRAVFDNSAASSGMGYDDWAKTTSAGIPMRRIGRPSDMGAAAAFLCSDLASYITGQVLLIDGGSVEALQ